MVSQTLRVRQTLFYSKIRNFRFPIFGLFVFWPSQLRLMVKFEVIKFNPGQQYLHESLSTMIISS